MKKFLLSTVAIAMLSTAASAADLDMAPEPILDNWAGWYAGINGGNGFSNDPDVDPLVSVFGGPYEPLNDQRRWDLDTSGFFGGGQVGFNWQDDIYVYGMEGDFQFSNIDGKDGLSDSEYCAGGPPCGRFTDYDWSRRVSQKLKWFSTVRGRAGVSPNESLLFYATAGLAFGQIKNKRAYELYDETPRYLLTESSYGSSSKTKVGWTAGFGSELKVTENVSFKVEYLYLDLGKTTVHSSLDFSCVANRPRACPRRDPERMSKHKFNNQFHTVKAGFNWGF
jgi:outer membrane immunogenic protein